MGSISDGMRFWLKVAVLTCVIFTQPIFGFSPGYYEIIQDFEFGAVNFLSLYLDNTTAFDMVTSHGCHCAKFNPSNNKHILGGANTVDELDSLCRKWVAARRCLNRYERGSCKDLQNTDYNFEVAIMVDSSSGLPNDAVCNDYHSTTSVPYNECEVDSCKVDAYYVKAIADYLDIFSDFEEVVADGSTCPQGSASGSSSGSSSSSSSGQSSSGQNTVPDDQKYCSGEAPHVQIMHGTAPTTIATTTQVPIIQEYGSTAIGHLVFVIDRSSDLSEEDYQSGIDFIVDTLEPLTISHNTTVVSLIGMSASSSIYIQEAFEQDDIDAAIAHIRTDQASVPDRDMAGAVEMSSRLLGLRTVNLLEGLISQTIVLVTGGASTTPGEMLDTNTGEIINIYEAISELNITAITIGIGENVNATELVEIASDPYLSFNLPSFEELHDVVEEIATIYVQVANDLLLTTVPPTTTFGMTESTTPFGVG